MGFWQSATNFASSLNPWVSLGVGALTIYGIYKSMKAQDDEYGPDFWSEYEPEDPFSAASVIQRQRLFDENYARAAIAAEDEQSATLARLNALRSYNHLGYDPNPKGSNFLGSISQEVRDYFSGKSRTAGYIPEETKLPPIPPDVYKADDPVPDSSNVPNLPDPDKRKLVDTYPGKGDHKGQAPHPSNTKRKTKPKDKPMVQTAAMGDHEGKVTPNVPQSPATKRKLVEKSVKVAAQGDTKGGK